MKQILATFSEIGRETLDKCEDLDCSVPDFIEGLTSIIVRLEAARDAAAEIYGYEGHKEKK